VSSKGLFFLVLGIFLAFEMRIIINKRNHNLLISLEMVFISIMSCHDYYLLQSKKWWQISIATGHKPACFLFKNMNLVHKFTWL